MEGEGEEGETQSLIKLLCPQRAAAIIGGGGRKARPNRNR